MANDRATEPLTVSLQTARVLLVRHGQTAWNAERRFLGRADVPLDATGLDQAERLGRRLRDASLAAVWSSPLSRARQTAAPLEANGPGAARIDPDLVEMDVGALEGLHPHELAPYAELLLRWREAPDSVRLPGGECVQDVLERGLAAMAHILATVAPGQTIAVVSHQLVLASLTCHYAGEPLSRLRSWMFRNTAITTLEVGSRVSVASFDDAAHLGGSPESGVRSPEEADAEGGSSHPPRSR